MPFYKKRNINNIENIFYIWGEVYFKGWLCLNNLLLILGMIALSNGNISLGNLPLFDNKDKLKTNNDEGEIVNGLSNKKKVKRERPSRKDENKKIIKKRKRSKPDNIIGFNMNDINKGMRLMELSDEDLERGMEVISRTKKYMNTDEIKILVKVESLLDLVKGIKKLSTIETVEENESDFFRSMDEEDKKNMMIKEILEVFPEKRKESVEKAINLKKKIDLFAELFLPDDFGEGGFSLSSLANISNLGSMNNLKLLGSLLRIDDDNCCSDYDEDQEYNDDDYEKDNNYYEEYDYIDEDE